MSIFSRCFRFCRVIGGRSGRSLVLVLVWMGFLGLLLDVAPVLANTPEVLTPRSGATIIARTPETHLILLQSPQAPIVRVQIGETDRWIDPLLSIEGEQGLYQHYRLPLKSGDNHFTLRPGGKKISLKYQQVQSELSLRPRTKDVYYFHQEGDLPVHCSGCHDLQQTSDATSVGLQKQDSCLTCHGNLVATSRWQHSTSVNRQCLSCHQQSVDPWKIGMPTKRIHELCFDCHTGKNNWKEKKVAHGPMNLGSCTLCHGPHGGDHRYQLWEDGKIDLCIACHSNMAQLVAAIREKKIPYVHGVITGPGCVACHDPHATDQLYVLKQPINELCSGCHPGPAAAEGHPVARHPVSGPREGLRPGRELSCTSCHEPHGSYNRYLLIETNLGGRLCRECHSR